MNRRTLLIALLGLPMSALPVGAAYHKPSEWTIINNKSGLPVYVSDSLISDCKAVHGIDITKIIPNMLGTEFHIEKKPLGNKKNTLAFSFYTNNKRDGYVVWTDGRKQKGFNVTDHIIRYQNINHKWFDTLNAPIRRSAILRTT